MFMLMHAMKAEGKLQGPQKGVLISTGTNFHPNLRQPGAGGVQHLPPWRDWGIASLNDAVKTPAETNSSVCGEGCRGRVAVAGALSWEGGWGVGGWGVGGWRGIGRAAVAGGKTYGQEQLGPIKG